MNISSFRLIRLLPFLAAVICFALLEQAQAGDPLMDRDGRTLSVSINGAPTTRISKKAIHDSQGSEAYEVFWTSKQKAGPLCITLKPQDARLGDPERITILVHEIHKERPYQNWKSYNLVPKPEERAADFGTAKGYCPTEYTLTERLRYPSLPAGEYVIRIAYWGVGNWDRQDVLLAVE